METKFVTTANKEVTIGNTIVYKVKGIQRQGKIINKTKNYLELKVKGEKRNRILKLKN